MKLDKLLNIAAVASLSMATAAFAQDTATGQAAEEQAGREVARQCLQDLQALNQDLIEGGYGVVGPQGYGAGGLGVGWAGTPGYGGTMATPRGQMEVAMNAAYIFAMQGDEEACQSVLAGIENMRDTYATQIRPQDMAATDLRTWRSEWLRTAVPVGDLETIVRADRLIGMDVRNPEDEDLGDVEDIILDAEGNIAYVLVSRGGFLGIDDRLYPVRWEDLRMTPSPYEDTLVLNVSEDALEAAPTIDSDMLRGLTAEEVQAEVGQFWDENVRG